MESIIKLKKLRKQYREFLLDDLDLEIPKGFITGMIGPNGAGKTTTIKLIMNLIKPDSGRVEIFGSDHIQDEVKIKDRIGYVGEEQYFYDFHSAKWTGNFVSHFYSRWDSDKYLRLLHEMKLPYKKMIRKYSKGMKVKLALAIALSHDPELIILDEPTSGLDPIVRREVLDLLQKYSLEENRSILISSHITDDLTRIADYIVYLLNGRSILFSSKDDLLSNWKKIHFRENALEESIVSLLENLEYSMFGGTGVTRHYDQVQDRLSKGISEGIIKVENVGLDDILISIVKGK